jgi:electron transfer flavoprotein beta subunit
MNIIVCIKQVPDTETVIKLSPEGKDIESQGIKYVVNPYDEYAIEEAVRIKEKNQGSSVVVVSIGPARAKEALRTCLAIGADRAVHLCDDAFLSGDAHLTAHVLATFIKTQPHDLILVGKQAIDDDSAQVGPALASLLDLPFVAVINKLELSPDQKKATLHREIEGATEVIEASLPALFSCQKGLNEPRYPSLRDIMQAKKKEIKEMKSVDLGLDVAELSKLSRTRVVKMEYPPRRPPGQLLTGDAHEVVQRLLHLLREEAKIL